MRGASGQYAETDRSFLADDSPGDHPERSGQEMTSNVNSLDQFFIAHSRNCHNMTAEEEMGE